MEIERDRKIYGKRQTERHTVKEGDRQRDTVREREL